jgi:hypothetical protein
MKHKYLVKNNNEEFYFDKKNDFIIYCQSQYNDWYKIHTQNKNSSYNKLQNIEITFSYDGGQTWNDIAEFKNERQSIQNEKVIKKSVPVSEKKPSSWFSYLILIVLVIGGLHYYNNRDSSKSPTETFSEFLESIHEGDFNKSRRFIEGSTSTETIISLEDLWQVNKSSFTQNPNYTITLESENNNEAIVSVADEFNQMRFKLNKIDGSWKIVMKSCGLIDLVRGNTRSDEHDENEYTVEIGDDELISNNNSNQSEINNNSETEESNINSSSNEYDESNSNKSSYNSSSSQNENTNQTKQWVNCRQCHGVGIRDDGRNCFKCDGIGQIEILTESDKKWVNCRQCHGSGLRDDGRNCFKCDGIGQTLIPK